MSDANHERYRILIGEEERLSAVILEAMMHRTEVRHQIDLLEFKMYPDVQHTQEIEIQAVDLQRFINRTHMGGRQTYNLGQAPGVS